MTDRIPESPYQREAAELANKEIGNTPGVLSGEAGAKILDKYEENEGLRVENAGLKNDNGNLELESRTNFLTGLPNERALEDFLKGIENAYKRSMNDPELPQITGSAIAIDLTGLKKVNDTFGRPVGDIYLKAVASSCTEAVRDEDHVFRLGDGSDEFTIFAPNLVEDEQVKVLMERIDNKLKQKEVNVKKVYPGADFSLSYVAVRYDQKTSPREAHELGQFQMTESKKRKERETGLRGQSVGKKII